MLGYDFNIFWEGARAILSGHSPYSVEGFFSPLPFAWLILPFGFLSFEVAYSIWTAINLLSLVVISKKDALRLILFLPVMFAIWVGQVDLLIIAAGFFGGWLGLAITTLKPQLSVWIVSYKFAEWWREGKRQNILYTLLAILVIYGIPSLLQPGWWNSWASAPPSIFHYASHASSLFGLSALFVNSTFNTLFFVIALAAISFILLRPFSRGRFLSWVAIFNPVANIYSLSIVFENVAIGLSWLLLPVSINLHTGLPWAFIPIYLLWRDFSDHKK